jgi:hypothetical protein
MPLCTIAIINAPDTLRLIINYDMRIVDCGISLTGKVYLVDHAGTISRIRYHSPWRSARYRRYGIR